MFFVECFDESRMREMRYRSNDDQIPMDKQFPCFYLRRMKTLRFPFPPVRAAASSHITTSVRCMPDFFFYRGRLLAVSWPTRRRDADDVRTTITHA